METEGLNKVKRFPVHVHKMRAPRIILMPIDAPVRASSLVPMRNASLLPALLFALSLTGPAHAQDPVKAAYFGLTFIDTSPALIHEEETRRTREISDRLVAALEQSGRYAFVDTAPVAERAKRYGNMTHCNGCDTEFARELGADVAISGVVQKTSNLIISLSVHVRDAQTGALVDGGSTDIRGNTDAMWTRGIDWLIKRRLLEE